jgi:hypothetical protein
MSGVCSPGDLLKTLSQTLENRVKTLVYAHFEEQASKKGIVRK